MSEPDKQALPRVLVVDDSRMVRATIVKHTRGRFDVREESDGEAGWQTLMLDPMVQVVISDLSMPKLDGYGLLARIRASRLPRIREVPVIMISGDEDEAARNRAKECGATDFITKGIGTVELLSRLDALVRLSRTSRELEASREALASNVIVDPSSGLPTGEYLKQQGRQALSHAQRHGGEISVLVVEIDRYEDLVTRHGQAVGEQLVKQFRTVLANRVRQEDTVSQTGTKQFTVVCPGSSMEDVKSFAVRLEQVIGKASIRYRGEQIRIGLRFGFANSKDDDWHSMTSLLSLAEGRTDQRSAPSEGRPGSDEGLSASLAETSVEGASPVLPEEPPPAEEAAAGPAELPPLEDAAASGLALVEPLPEPAAGEPIALEPIAPEPAAGEPIALEPIAPESAAREPAAAEPAAAEPAVTGVAAGELTIEQALALLRQGDEDRVKPGAAVLMKQLVPLLKVIDRELRLGMHINEAEAKLNRFH